MSLVIMLTVFTMQLWALYLGSRGKFHFLGRTIPMNWKIPIVAIGIKRLLTNVVAMRSSPKCKDELL